MQKQIERGDNLHHKLDNQMYLVLQVDYNEDYILIGDTKGNRYIIGTDANTLSKFTLINNQ